MSRHEGKRSADQSPSGRPFPRGVSQFALLPATFSNGFLFGNGSVKLQPHKFTLGSSLRRNWLRNRAPGAVCMSGFGAGKAAGDDTFPFRG